MTHIFVSHATADDAIVTQIHDAVEKATGRELWVDHFDLKPPLSNYRETLQKALQDCEAGLLILSKNSIGRPEIDAEWNYILVTSLPLFIAKIDDVPFKDINARLSLVPWIELNNNWDKGIDALGAAILGQPAPSGAPVVLHRSITGHMDRRLTIPISGREEDLGEIKRLLRRGPTAILGVGGIGKSRLAAEIVSTIDGIAGVVWHTANELSRADEVLDLLRDHLKMETTASRKVTLAKLRTTKCLIVLDNAEDISPDEPRRKDYISLVDDLYDAGALVLLTSRVEWDDIQLCRTYIPQTVSAEAARQIVMDMGEAFAISYDLSPQASIIAEAARFHPRLIEWAVRQTKKFPPDKVIHDLKELKSDRVQEALNEMILKTFHQMILLEGENVGHTLKVLNVCRGGFTYEAAANISVVTKEVDRIDRDLETLQTWQFIVFRNGRYDIDLLVIAAIGEDETAYYLHSDYYGKLAEQFVEQGDFLSLDEESLNLQLALRHSLKRLDTEQFTRISDSLNNSNKLSETKFRDSWKKTLDELGAALDTCRVLREKVREILKLIDEADNKENISKKVRKKINAIDPLDIKVAQEFVIPIYIITQKNLAQAYLFLKDKSSATACLYEVERFQRQLGDIEDADDVAKWITEIEDISES